MSKSAQVSPDSAALTAVAGGAPPPRTEGTAGHTGHAEHDGHTGQGAHSAATEATTGGVTPGSSKLEPDEDQPPAPPAAESPSSCATGT